MVTPNYANPHPVFKPAMRVITAITNSSPAIVTTSFAHGYINGLIVRLDIPLLFGMQQANHMQGEIVVTGDTTFTIDIDTTLFDIFTNPSPGPQNYTSAQVVPIGENNRILTGAVQNVLPYQ
jgi:hypothetical protein